MGARSQTVLSGGLLIVTIISLKRYIKLIGIHYRSALLAEMEYRTNFISSFAYSILWVVWIALGVGVFLLSSSDSWWLDTNWPDHRVFPVALSGHARLLVR